MVDFICLRPSLGQKDAKRVDLLVVTGCRMKDRGFVHFYRSDGLKPSDRTFSATYVQSPFIQTANLGTLNDF